MKLWNIFALLLRTVVLKIWSVDFPTGSFRGSMRLDRCPSLNNHSMFVIFPVKVVFHEKSDQLNLQLKCTSAFPWDNCSICSRRALCMLPILMYQILKRCLCKGWDEIIVDIKTCNCLIFCSWYSVMKCVNVWHICILHWTHIFQMTNAWCCKIPSKWKINWWILIEEYEKLISIWFQILHCS